MKIGSLCSGYEGLGMAVQAVLGGELAWVADSDPGAAAILAHRFPSLPNLGDISAADWSAVESVDVLTAGFPCQDVSCAGGRAGLREGNRTGVWAYVARAIDELRPPLVVLENVRGLLSAGADSDVEPCPWCLGEAGNEHPLRALGAVLGDLADLRYDARWAVVSAADAGAPHRRERVFIVAADAGRDEPRRDGAVSGFGQKDEGRRPGAGGRFAAPHPDRPAGGERRIAAPGEAESRRARADAGGRGRAPVADADRAGCAPRLEPQARRRESGRAGTSVDRAGHGGRGIAPDTYGSGRGTHESGLRQGQPDAGRLIAADAYGAPGGRYGPGRGPGALQGSAVAERAPEQPGRRDSGSGGELAVDWRQFGPAITQWGAILGRPAPRPTEPGRTGERLSPRFVEWMMGLPEGWVTDVPGLSRNAQLKALGNGVVPQQAAMALRLLLERADIAPLVAAKGAA